MKLSKNSWHRKFYYYTFDKEPGVNFCDYFWALAAAMLFLPLTWPMYLLTAALATREQTKFKDIEYNPDTQKFEETREDMTYKEKFKYYNPSFGYKILLGFLINLFVVCFIMAITKNTGATILSILGLIVFLGAVSFVQFLGQKIPSLTPVQKVSEEIEEIKTVMVGGFKSFKDKNCPLIDWDDMPSEAGKSASH